jgi:hypothetical protein
MPRGERERGRKVSGRILPQCGKMTETAGADGSILKVNDDKTALKELLLSPPAKKVS